MSTKLKHRARPVVEADRASDGRGHVALVTGASSGIGLAFARLLAAKGYDVVPVARRLNRLESLQRELEPRWDVRVHPVVADLSRPDATERIVAALAEHDLRVDFLVNNAGFTLMGRFGDKDWKEYESYLRVLGTAPIELTHALLPAMVAQRWGRIISVCSIAAAMQSSPTSILYSATKSMVQRFSEGVAHEYASDGINATASLPGMTATEIFQAGGYQKYVDGHRGAQMTMMQPEDFAREAYVAVMAGKRTIVHGAPNKIAVSLLLHTPIAVRRKLAAAMTGAIKFD